MSCLHGRHLCIRLVTGVLVLCIGPGHASAQVTDIGALQDFVDARLENVREALIDMRRDIHRNPEISGQEVRTAALVADRLRALGLEVRTGVGGHGVVATLRGDIPGPTVAFRADMDAVRSTAPDPVDFRSENRGVRHICGHDIHTVVGLALAEGLTAVRGELPGSVLFVFQPAEETATGAQAMLADGLFETVRPSAIFAFHTAPLEVGRIGTKSGVLLPGRDQIAITVSGYPDGRLVDSLLDLIRSTATLSPEDESVVGDFARIEVAGARTTGEGATAIRATATTSGPEARARVEAALRQGLEELQEEGVELSLAYEAGSIAGATNDPRLEARARDVLRSVLGDSGLVVIESVPTRFSEDFGSFQAQVPGVMYYLGVSNSAKGWIGMPHSASYVADEGAIEVGARAMAAVILDFLFSQARPSSSPSSNE